MKFIRIKQAGFTLVELLVGLVVSLFIVGIALTYMVSSSQAFRIQNNNDLIQENARYTLELLTRNIRLAGHNRFDIALAASEKMNVIFSDAKCPATAVSGTGTDTSLCTDDIEVSGDNLSDRFAIDYLATSGQTCNNVVVADGTHIASIFWSGNTSGGQISSLYCQAYNIDTDAFIGTAVPIVDGVDAIQLQYGVDTVGDDGVVDTYQSYTEFAATGLPATDIRTIRIGVLLNSGVSIAADQTEDTASRTYQLLDSDPLVFNDRILRQIFTTTVYLANQFNNSDI